MLLNHIFSTTSSGGLIKFMTGTNLYISTNTEHTPGNVLLNVTMMTLVISMLTYIATVYMGVIPTLEIQSLDGQTTSISTTRKAIILLHQSSPTISMMPMETRTNSCPITGTGEVESMVTTLTRQQKSFVLSDVLFLGLKSACTTFGDMDIASWEITSTQLTKHMVLQMQTPSTK